MSRSWQRAERLQEPTCSQNHCLELTQHCYGLRHAHRGPHPTSPTSPVRSCALWLCPNSWAASGTNVHKISQFMRRGWVGHCCRVANFAADYGVRMNYGLRMGHTGLLWHRSCSLAADLLSWRQVRLPEPQDDQCAVAGHAAAAGRRVCGRLRRAPRGPVSGVAAGGWRGWRDARNLPQCFGLPPALPTGAPADCTGTKIVLPMLIS